MDILHNFLTLAVCYLLGVCMGILVITVRDHHELHIGGFSVMVVEFNQ
jgi:accessory gene regulator protein AgrB